MIGLPDFREDLRHLYPEVSYLWIVGALWLAAGTFVSVGMLRLIAPKLRTEQHWTEIARRKYPVLVSLSLLSIGLVAGQFGADLLGHRGVVMPGWVIRTAMVMGAMLGYWGGLRMFFARYAAVVPRDRVSPPVSMGANLLLRWGHLLLAALFAASFQEFGAWMPLYLAIFCAFVLWYAAGGGVALLLAVGWACPLDQARQESLRALAAIPNDVPLYELRSRSANAFALPSKRIILATTECLAVLDDLELASVLKHELGHLHESKRVRFVRIGAGFFFALVVAISPLAVRTLGEIAGLYAVLGCLLVVVLVSRWLLRDTEKHADDHAKEGDPITYARALERIYEANGVPAVLRGKGGLHGHLYDRVVALGVQPSYPRPLPPPRGIVANVFAVVLATGVLLASVSYGHVNDGWSLGVSGASPYRVGGMAYAANASGDSRRAIALYGFQSTLDKSPDPLANLAIVSGNAKQCELSEEAIASARARFQTWDPRLKVVFRNAVTSVLLCKPSSSVAAAIRNEIGPDPEDAYDDYDSTLD